MLQGRRGKGPTPEELEFIYGLLREGYGDSDILEKYEELRKHGKLGSLPYRHDIRFIRQRRRGFEAARRVLEDDYRRRADPVLAERRREHWDRLADIAQQLHDQLSIPDFQRLHLDDIQPGHLLSSLPEAKGWIYDWDKLSNEPTIRLIVEDINPLLFSGLLSHLAAEFSKFDLTGWKKEAGKLIQRWHSLATEISAKYVELTGMTVSKHGEAGLTPSLVPFHCDWLVNNLEHKGEYMELETSPTSGQPALAPPLKLHPKGLPAWPLAYGDAQQIGRCQRSAHLITDLYIEKPQIKHLANHIEQVSEKASELRSIVSLVAERRSFQGSCAICLPWGA